MSKLYYSIGEVCKILDIKPYVLRYWETEFTQIKTKRTRGNIRKYTPENLLILKKIKNLLYEKKYTIAGVKKLLNKNKIESEALDKKIILEKLKEIKSLIDEMIN
jgi:DNA-binding transcriptional MerR regulator